MEFSKILIYFIYSALFLLIIVKSVLFFKSTSSPRLDRYFYFNMDSICNSASLFKEKAKILQNKLSIAIIIVALFAVTVSYIIFK